MFYTTIYRLLDPVTPLDTDCGDLCGQACCRVGDPAFGIYLLPGEETMFTGRETWLGWEKQLPQQYDFPPTWVEPVYFVHCRPPCPRPHRPIQCRTFPLAPHLLPDGKLVLIWETLSLPYVCPLISKKMPLRQDFILALGQTWKKLISYRRIHDLVAWDARQRAHVEIIYVPG